MKTKSHGASGNARGGSTTSARTRMGSPRALLKQAEALQHEARQLADEAMQATGAAEARDAAACIRRRKGRVAVFLGAGASKAFGWPLTSELLPAILKGIADNDLFEDNRINTRAQNRSDRKLLQKVLAALCPGLAVTTASRLPLVTHLLSMLDYSLATGQALIHGLTADETRHARVLMERAIFEIIEHEPEEDGRNNWPMRRANALTRRFATWLGDIRSNPAVTGIITSNYDSAIEEALGFDGADPDRIQSLGIDLGFPWLWAANDEERVMPRPARPKRRIYKLHGSTTWLRCGLCERIHINPDVDVAIYAFDRKADDNNTCHCGHAKLEVQIVSPSFVRGPLSTNMAAVWQAALDWLRASEEWVIVGYSFPDEDLNIRSLFARALATSKRPVVTVVQRGANEQTRTRYEAFFPKKQLRYLTGGLETFLNATGRSRQPRVPAKASKAPPDRHARHLGTTATRRLRPI